MLYLELNYLHRYPTWSQAKVIDYFGLWSCTVIKVKGKPKFGINQEHLLKYWYILLLLYTYLPMSVFFYFSPYQASNSFKRNFDEIDRTEFIGFVKKNFGNVDNSEWSSKLKVDNKS